MVLGSRNSRLAHRYIRGVLSARLSHLDDGHERVAVIHFLRARRVSGVAIKPRRVLGLDTAAQIAAIAYEITALIAPVTYVLSVRVIARRIA